MPTNNNTNGINALVPFGGGGGSTRTGGSGSGSRISSTSRTGNGNGGGGEGGGGETLLRDRWNLGRSHTNGTLALNGSGGQIARSSGGGSGGNEFRSTDNGNGPTGTTGSHGRRRTGLGSANISAESDGRIVVNSGDGRRFGSSGPGRGLGLAFGLEGGSAASNGPPDSPNVTRIPNSEGLYGRPAYIVSIPQGARGGRQFPVTVGGQQLMVDCPPNARPGMPVRIVPPGPPGNVGRPAD